MPTSVVLLLAERHAAALTVVDTVLTDLTAELPSPGLPFYLGLRSELSFGTGDWSGASSPAHEALRLAEEQGSRAIVKLARATTPADDDDLVVQAVEALALLLLGCGRPTEAAAVGSELGGPPSLRLGADVVEALVRAGQCKAAERTLEGVAGAAERTGHAWAQAAVRRCRVLLAQGHLPRSTS